MSPILDWRHLCYGGECLRDDRADNSPTADRALTLYYTQLVLNLVWMPLFFTGEHNDLCEAHTSAKKPVLALVDIVALTATVWKMTTTMGGIGTRISTNWFLLPYSAWLGYATYLNAGHVYLNWVSDGPSSRAHDRIASRVRIAPRGTRCCSSRHSVIVMKMCSGIRGSLSTGLGSTPRRRDPTCALDWPPG